MNFSAITTVNVKGLVYWRKEVHSDANLQKIIKDLVLNPNYRDRYQLQGNH